MIYNINGGKAIDAGGYGCIFRPQLKCKEQPPGTKYEPDGVSKLMPIKHIKSEMNEINRIKPYVNNIPDNYKYFLIDNIYHCEPKSLRIEDKNNFNETCANLMRININKNNVDKNLDKLGIINLPYGGENVYQYLKKLLLEKLIIKKKFITLNNSLIDLLNNAIIPLNNNKLLHLDLKGQNILYDDKSHYARLIDWGLSDNYVDGTIPKSLQYKPLQFNLPISVILFDNNILNKYLPKISSNKSELYAKVHKMVKNELENKGHFFTIAYILTLLYPSTILTLADVVDFITKYLLEILIKYNTNGNFDSVRFFFEVFSKNVDVYGFLSSYMPLIENKDKSNNKLSKQMRNILSKYCFSSSYSYKPIDINKLNKNLLDLNVYNNKSKKDKYFTILNKSLSKLKKTSIKKTLKKSLKKTLKKNNKTN